MLCLPSVTQPAIAKKIAFTFGFVNQIISAVGKPVEKLWPNRKPDKKPRKFLREIEMAILDDNNLIDIIGPDKFREDLRFAKKFCRALSESIQQAEDVYLSYLKSSGRYSSHSFPERDDPQSI